MGFFDSLFGSNTSAGTQAGVQQGIAALQGAQTAGNQALSTTTGQANQALSSGAGSALDAILRGYGAATGAVSGYGNQAQGQLASGVNQAANTALGGASAFQPYASAGAGASNLYNDAIGLGGSAGTAAAQSAFRASPGYDFQVQQATGAAQRAAGAAGMLGSGNTLDAITRLGSDLADQEYGNFVSNLNTAAQRGLGAASGIAGADQGAASIQYGGANTGAQLQQQTGTMLGNLSSQGGLAQGNVDTGLGSGLSSNFDNLGARQSSLGLGVAQDVSNAAITGGKAEDSATNANSGIFSKLIGSLTGLPFGGVSSSAGNLLSGFKL